MSVNTTAHSQSQRIVVEAAVGNKQTYASSNLGLSQSDFNRPAKSDGQRLLHHSDSGYISPTVPPGISPQTPSKGLQSALSAKFQAGLTVTTEGSNRVETDAADKLETDNHNHSAEVMQSVVQRSRESQGEYRERILPDESVSCLTACVASCTSPRSCKRLSYFS